MSLISVSRVFELAFPIYMLEKKGPEVVDQDEEMVVKVMPNGMRSLPGMCFSARRLLHNVFHLLEFYLFITCVLGQEFDKRRRLIVSNGIDF